MFTYTFQIIIYILFFNVDEKATAEDTIRSKSTDNDAEGLHFDLNHIILFPKGLFCLQILENWYKLQHRRNMKSKPISFSLSL